MPEVNDPKLLDALQQLFASRNDLRTIVEYQQRLFASIQELGASHKAVDTHIRKLTDSHNRVQNDTSQLVRLRHETNDNLRSLADSHRQTREQIRQAMETITYIQQEVRKIPQLEARIDALEQVSRGQDQRIRKLEQA